MASENIEDWDQSLPSSVEVEEESEGLNVDEKDRRQNILKLNQYVRQMSYRAVTPPFERPRTESLAVTKKTAIVGTLKDFEDVVTPRTRGDRIKRITAKYNTMSTEQLEYIIKQQRRKERRKENLLKRKQEIYYDMLTKLERQCRTQYLNVLIRKFSSFIAKLATTMRIPPQLIEPYARMQRGIFCNILRAIDVQPTSQAAFFYNTQEGQEYEICHKLAHALLSLIIKALDSASIKKPGDIQPMDVEFDLDNYIKDRLMCAAEKKINNARKKSAPPVNPLDAIFKKCQNFSPRHKC